MGVRNFVSANVVVYSMSECSQRKYSTLCSRIAMYAQVRSSLVHGLTLRSSRQLLKDSLSVTVAVIPPAVFRRVYSAVSAGDA